MKSAPFPPRNQRPHNKSTSNTFGIQTTTATPYKYPTSPLREVHVLDELTQVSTNPLGLNQDIDQVGIKLSDTRPGLCLSSTSKRKHIGAF